MPASLTGYLWLKGHQPMLPGWPCPLRSLTGVPCPGCFLTRATSASLHGDWSEALSQHAFGPLVATALVVWSIQALRQRRLAPQGLKRWHAGVLGSTLLAYWGIRAALQYGLGMEVFPAT